MSPPISKSAASSNYVRFSSSTPLTMAKSCCRMNDGNTMQKVIILIMTTTTTMSLLHYFLSVDPSVLTKVVSPHFTEENEDMENVLLEFTQLVKAESKTCVPGL